MPKRTKYRKVQKGRLRGLASLGSRTVTFCEYGLVAKEPGRITARQIEAIRVTVGRKLKKEGELFLRVFPDKPVTKKGGEMPMGKGKGAVDHYVAIVKPGTVMFEVAGMDEATSKKVLDLAAYKLPIKCKFVSK